jgi:TatD DNase family protein
VAEKAEKAEKAENEAGPSEKKRKRKSRERDETPPPAPEPLPAPVGDSHTHMDMQEPAAADIIAAAAAVNVRTLVQVGVDVPSSQTAVELAAAFDRVHATVALHPNEAPRLVLGDPDGWSGQDRAPGGPEALEAALAEIDKLAADEQVRGIGETGLDYFRTGPEGVQAQQDSFRAHIAIAKHHGKALVIHDREAHEDVLRILLEEGSPETVVFHCYSGDAAMAQVCAERGYYMSFAGNLTYKANQALQEAFQTAPLDRILVETDAPFLTPLPYRGRPNAPYLVPYTVRAMAALRGIDSDAGLAELCQALDSNLGDAFKVQA